MPWKSMAASIGTGLVNNALSQENAAVHRDWQEKMWKMQNAYNHPAAMADRMRAAGLNPYMMQGAEPAGSVGTGAPAQTIPLDNPLAYAKTFAEIDNLTANTTKTGYESEKLLKEFAMLDLLLERGLIEKKEYEFRMEKYFEAWKDKNPFTLEAENTEADTGLKKAQTETEEKKQENLGADTGLKQAQTATEGQKQINLSSENQILQDTIALNFATYMQRVGNFNLENAIKGCELQMAQFAVNFESFKSRFYDVVSTAEASTLVEQLKSLELSNEIDSVTASMSDVYKTANQVFGFDVRVLPSELQARLLGDFKEFQTTKSQSSLDKLFATYQQIDDYINKNTHIVTSVSSSKGFGRFGAQSSHSITY